MRTSLAQVESGINLLDTHTRQSKASLYFRLGLLFRRLMYDEWKVRMMKWTTLLSAAQNQCYFKKRKERKKSDEEPLVMHHTELKYLLDYDHSIGGNWSSRNVTFSISVVLRILFLFCFFWYCIYYCIALRWNSRFCFVWTFWSDVSILHFPGLFLFPYIFVLVHSFYWR